MSGPAGTSRTRARRLGIDPWLASAAILLALHFFAFPLASHALVSDVRHYVYFANLLASGGVLYRDVFELKTPLASFLGGGLAWVGGRLGWDTVLTVRLGYLALAVGAGVLAFQVHRHLAKGRGLPALVALAPYAGFFLIGGLPCIGNVPKLVMALSAAGCALLVRRQSFVAAGALAAAAFLDWQIGILVPVGLALSCLARPKVERLGAMLRAGLGMSLLLVLTGLWLGLHGALREGLRQMLVASFYRGTSTWNARDAATEWLRRGQLIASGCSGELWLLLAAALGLALARRRLRESSLGAGGWVLGVYHFGIVAFSLVDFQGFGDLYALLHSAAFFAGIALSEALLRWGGTVSTRPAQAVVALVCIVLAVLACRPWVARSSWTLAAMTQGGAFGIEEQRLLASRLGETLKGKRALFLGPSEMRVLSGHLEGGRLVVWTPATYFYSRSGAGEPPEATLARLLTAARPDLVVCDLGYPLEASTGGRFQKLRDETQGRYGVALFAPTGGDARSSTSLSSP